MTLRSTFLELNLHLPPTPFFPFFFPACAINVGEKWAHFEFNHSHVGLPTNLEYPLDESLRLVKLSKISFNVYLHPNLGDIANLHWVSARGFKVFISVRPTNWSKVFWQKLLFQMWFSALKNQRVKNSSRQLKAVLAHVIIVWSSKL